VVDPGSLAGVLAVAERSIGFVSKLLAEGIEEIDRGQVEAVMATGATRLQTLLYAIVPQIKPVFAGICIYRWDINMRESTVLGFGRRRRDWLRAQRGDPGPGMEPRGDDPRRGRRVRNRSAYIRKRVT
jgi:hypothetical protein